MRAMFWLLVLAAVVAGGYWVWHARRRWEERRRAGEERFASFMAEATRNAKPKDLPAAAAPEAAAPEAPGALAQQKLLFDAAARAGEAGEAALAIQLYARLLARYPQTAFAEQARAGVESQKKRLSKA